MLPVNTATPDQPSDPTRKHAEETQETQRNSSSLSQRPEVFSAPAQSADSRRAEIPAVTEMDGITFQDCNPTNSEMSQQGARLDIAANAASTSSLTSSLPFADMDDYSGAVLPMYEVNEAPFVDFLKDIIFPDNVDANFDPNTTRAFDLHSPNDIFDFTKFPFSNHNDSRPANHLPRLEESPSPGTSERYGDQRDANHVSPQIQKVVLLGEDAFNKSLWTWIPEEGGSQRKVPLSVVLAESPESLPVNRDDDREQISVNIQPVTRNRLLSLLLSCSAPCDHERILSSFPSLTTLNQLVQDYLVYHGTLTDGWIHFPTLELNEQPPELIFGLIAAGARLSTCPKVQNMGLALHDLHRDLNEKNITEDNRKARKLSSLQSLALGLVTGLSSGDGRRTEINEALINITVTMLRRNGGFCSKRPKLGALHADDDPDLVEIKWKQWVEQESLKRLAIHVSILCAYNSMTVFTPPLVTCGDLSLSLPASLALWKAPTAKEWKEKYLSLGVEKLSALPSLNSCVEDHSPVLEFEGAVDSKLSALAILAGLWEKCWWYRERANQCNLASQKSSRKSSFAVAAAYEEAREDLETFKVAFLQCAGEMDGTAVFYERQLMHLHVSLSDVHLFGGRLGESEARRVLPRLIDWAGTRDARQAIWHAGQMLRAARKHSPHQAPSAIAIYQASLALWAYSVVSWISSSREQAPPRSSTAAYHVPPLSSSEYVLLDGEDNSKVEQFLVLGRGIPAITSHRTNASFEATIPLFKTKDVMFAVAEILSDPVCFCHFSGLVRNLSQLVKALGNAAIAVQSI